MRCKIFECPRWTPSKIPMVIMVGLFALNDVMELNIFNNKYNGGNAKVHKI